MVVFDWVEHKTLRPLPRVAGTGSHMKPPFGAETTYTVYQKEVAARSGFVAIGCWAHARRYFFEAQGENPAAAGRILTVSVQLARGDALPRFG